MGPCPYHRASAQAAAPSERRLPGEWQTARYPGDAALIVLLTNGEDIGDVRVQEYGTDSFKVGSFLPGVVECSPGDTPKVWPERSEWVTDRPAAAKVLGRYLIEAFRAGWRLYTV